MNMKDKYFRMYVCKKCGYTGEEREVRFFYDGKGTDEENIIDETPCCPNCEEYEDFEERKF